MSTRIYSNCLLLWTTACLSVALRMDSRAVWAQVTPPSTIQNSDFEDVDESSNFMGWSMPEMLKAKGYRLFVETDNVHSGERAACLDATQTDDSSGGFGNVMQSIDATPFRGERVRFQAVVRTENLQDDGRAQLWLRVDRKSMNGQPQMGAFDNMQDRPIQSDVWKQYQIVLKVDDDAERIVLGLLFLGKGKAWIDDATLEIVNDKTATTGGSLSSDSADKPQPFFNHWLWLPLVAITLFVLSQWDVIAESRQRTESPALTDGDAPTVSENAGSYLETSSLQRFALHFSVSYWLVYSLPSPIASLLPFVGWKFQTAYSAGVDTLTRWTAFNVLGIERPLIPPGGSGDTTFDYVGLFLCFTISLVIAVIWSIVDRRKTRHPLVNDLLRSYLRYVLAFTMIGYGLAKVGSTMNQFPAPGVEQLMKSYGESSPMNLLWTFMGASKAYTFFAGLAETVAALLLIWRRTTTLGAVVVVGVMTNIVMMNFCYDVPVKQYSSHLLLMALYLLLPEIPRLANVFVWNRPTRQVCWRPVYANGRRIWVQRLFKAYLILMGIALPLFGTIRSEFQPAVAVSAPKFYGSYEVMEFTRDGKAVPALQSDGTRWRLVSLRRLPYRLDGGSGQTDYASIRMMTNSPTGSAFTLSDDEQVIEFQSVTDALPTELKVRIVDESNIELSSDSDSHTISAKLRRVNLEDFLLVKRGFRWINEFPYNR